MKNAIIAAIVAAVISSSGAFAAGVNYDGWAHEQRQDDKISRLQHRVACLSSGREGAALYRCYEMSAPLDGPR